MGIWLHRRTRPGSARAKSSPGANVLAKFAIAGLKPAATRRKELILINRRSRGEA
jgi:hypothetical protein